MKITLTQAKTLLEQGKNVALPTETVYGLAAKYNNQAAVEKIFILKGRPRENPLIIHLANLSQLESFMVTVPEVVKQLACHFWPGAMTLVVPIIAESVPVSVRANLATCAFRIPKDPLTRSLIEMTGPLVMPSANLSGHPSATTCSHVEADFGKDFPVLDGGMCQQGLESTILLIDTPVKIVRQGILTPENFVPVLGYAPKIGASEKKPLCPGQLFGHYSPRAQLILATNVLPGATVVGFIDRDYPGCNLYSLGSLLKPSQVAQNLYATLRKLDIDGIKQAYVDIDFPDNALFATIKERLYKAAGKL